MRAILLILAVCALSASAAPKLSAPNPDVKFGKRSEGTLLNNVFTLKNTGDSPLLIETVRKCSCITIDLPEKTIAPGKEIYLQATINFSNMQGPITKSIFLKTNDSKTPVTALRFTGEVFRYIDLSPAAVFFEMPKREYTLVKHVKIEMQGEKPIQITGIEDAGAPFAHSLKEITPGKLYQLTVMCKGFKDQRTRADSDLILLTDLPEKARVRLSLSARLTPPIFVTPQKLRLTRGQSSSVYLHLRGGSVKKFKLEKVELPDPRAASQVFDMPGGRGYRVRISGLIADDALKPDAKVVLVTDAAIARRIEIPIEVFE